MGNFVEPYIVDAIQNCVREGMTIRPIMQQLEIAKGTVERYRNLLLISEPNLRCKCGAPIGHRGWCHERVKSSPARQIFLANWQPNRIYIHTQRKTDPSEKPLPLLRWPFMVGHRELPPFLIEIERIVPKTLPEHIRADVCQELSVSILSGEINEVHIPFVWRDVMKRVYKMHPGKYGPVSLDQPIRGTEDLVLGDTITGEDGRYIVFGGELAPSF